MPTSSSPSKQAPRWPRISDYIPMPDSVIKQIENTWSSEFKS
jgi:hypothetical protein